MSSPRGFPVVLSSPSGGGKSTIAEELVKAVPGVVRSRSATTRSPRPGERNGVDYDFIDRAEFLRRRDAGGFVEWAEVHGNLYGTPREFFEAECARGNHPLLVIDVQGGFQVRRLVPDCLLVFLMPPSQAELERRLVGRGMGGEELKTRLHNAEGEIAEAGKYDYIVVNDKLDHAVAQLMEILDKERQNRSRNR